MPLGPPGANHDATLTSRSLLHLLFVVVAAIGGVYLVIVHKRIRKLERIARNQAEMIQFAERRKRITVAAIPV